MKAAARDLAARLEALAKEKAPGRVRRRRDPKGFVVLEVKGRGKRNLPGGRPDDRDHVVRIAYDGAFLQLTYRVGDDLRDSRLISFPTADHLAVCEAFLRKSLARLK